jgi:transposase-like protein
MAKISISEAARQVGISRSALYRSYIKTGKISVDRNSQENPTIDTSELLRVFGEQFGATSKATEVHTQKTQMDTAILEAEIVRLSGLVALYEQQLAEAKVREDWLRAKLDAMEQRQLTGPDTKRRWWWPW